MLSRLLAWTVTLAGLVLIVVLVTGGFRFDIGPVRISAHGLVPPLVVMAAAAAVLAWHRAVRAREAFAGITAVVTSAAPLIVVAAASAMVAVGIGYGTFSASASDASAYVSHSRLIASGRLTFDEPLARAVDWHEPTWTFAPLGYRPGATGGTLVPGYPLGLPLVMAVARWFMGENGPYAVAPVLALLAVFATWAIAARFGGTVAGIIASVLLASSPIVHFQVVQPMSDVPAMAWWTIAVACAARRTIGGSLAAGGVASLAVLTRPNLAPLAAVVTAVALGWPRVASSAFDVRRPGAFLAALVPGVLVVAGLQYLLYGSPLRSGYGDISDFFALANIWPNAVDYSRKIFAGEAPALALATVALAARGILGARLSESATALVKIAAATAAVVLAIYLPYGVFPDWGSFRFLMPVLPLAFAAAGAVASAALDRLPSAVRGVAVLAALTAVVCVNVTQAGRQGAYALRDYEARYRTVGRYLSRSLTMEAVIVTSQESGSARYYTGLPVLRWDLLTGDLETALARLQALGRRPVLVIEDWEKPALRQRFPSGPIASLDWAPRAETGRTTRVGVWDPADRGTSVVTTQLR